MVERSFQRSFRLPPDAAGDRIDAVFKNGILSARMRKAQASAGDTRHVSIRTE
jgi:HSP20 family molecular chaperone IbpA